MSDPSTDRPVAGTAEAERYAILDMRPNALPLQVQDDEDGRWHHVIGWRAPQGRSPVWLPVVVDALSGGPPFTVLRPRAYSQPAYPRA